MQIPPAGKKVFFWEFEIWNLVLGIWNLQKLFQNIIDNAGLAEGVEVEYGYFVFKQVAALVE